MREKGREDPEKVEEEETQSSIGIGYNGFTYCGPSFTLTRHSPPNIVSSQLA